MGVGLSKMQLYPAVLQRIESGFDIKKVGIIITNARTCNFSNLPVLLARENARE